MLRSLLAIALLLLGSFLSVGARAQTDRTGGGGADGVHAPVKSAYDQHMDNGVKLYGEENWPAAIAEFQAAYKAKPNASPLINLALCYKKLSAYAKAIEVLARAVDKHAGTMQPHHKEAAEKEIRELQALIAWVLIKVKPASAKLYIDGKEHAYEDDEMAFQLSPGPHKFRAEAEGYRAAEKSATLVSGKTNATVELTLASTQGELNVIAFATEAWIEVDGKKLAKGRYVGSFAPGVHAVRIFHDGEVNALNVVLQAGKQALVKQTKKGKLESESAAPGDIDKPDPNQPTIPKVLEGFYAVGCAALLTLPTDPYLFSRKDTGQGGYAFGANVGYRVANWAAFELFGQYSDVRVKGSFAGGIAGGSEDARFVLKSGRIGGALRVMLPGDTIFRFLGLAGAGMVIEELSFNNAPSSPDHFTTQSGVGVFGQIDLGVEVEISRILIDLVMQNTAQSSKHLETDSGLNAFEERPVFLIGPSIRVGYAFW